MGERIGWIRQVRWFGCLGMAISSLTFYYLPMYAGHNFCVALIPAVMLPFFDIVGVVWAYTLLYVFAGVLTFIIKVPQPNHGEWRESVKSPVTSQ